MSDEDRKRRLEEAIRQRDEFLEQNPRLKPLQREIDRAFEGVGEDSEERLKIIQEMIIDILREELAPAVEDLGKSYKELEENVKGLKEELEEAKQSDLKKKRSG
jgi:hypothetical protein